VTTGFIWAPPESQDERPAGRNRVGEQSQADIPAAKPLSHDAGANDGDQQKGRGDQLDQGGAGDGAHQPLRTRRKR